VLLPGGGRTAADAALAPPPYRRRAENRAGGAGSGRGPVIIPRQGTLIRGGSAMRWTELFARKPVADHRGHGPEASRVLGAGALVAMGIGATIGSGIFVTTGQVARAVAGPGVML